MYIDEPVYSKTYCHFFMRTEQIPVLSECVPEVGAGYQGRQQTGGRTANPGVVVSQEIRLHPDVHLAEDPLTGQPIPGHLSRHPLQAGLRTAFCQLMGQNNTFMYSVYIGVQVSIL